MLIHTVGKLIHTVLNLIHTVLVLIYTVLVVLIYTVFRAILFDTGLNFIQVGVVVELALELIVWVVCLLLSLIGSGDTSRTSLLDGSDAIP